MLSSPENPDRQIDRMAGCASMGLWIWKWVVRLLLVLALMYLAISLFYVLFWSKWQETSLQKFRAKVTLRELRVGLGHCRMEYDKLPIEPHESRIIRSDGELLFSLLGNKTAANPREIRFIDPPVARDGINNGLVGYYGSGEETPEDISLVDPWGERYYLMLESTGDNRIPNPERLPGAKGKATQSAPESIPASAIIFSSGPDKDPKTWDDNLCSWR